MVTNNDRDKNPSHFEITLFLCAVPLGILMFWFFDLPATIGTDPIFTTQRALLFSVVVITLGLAITDFFGKTSHRSIKSVIKPIISFVYGLDIGGGFVFAAYLLQGLGFV